MGQLTALKSHLKKFESKQDAIFEDVGTDTPLFDSVREVPVIYPNPTPKQSATQLASWDELQETIGERRSQVLAIIIAYGPVTTKGVAAELGWEINNVSGRITELRDEYSLIEEHDSVTDPVTNRKCSRWKVKDSTYYVYESRDSKQCEELPQADSRDRIGHYLT